jgi:putative phosphoesterase
MASIGTHIVGLVSDTHGLVRGSVHEALAGVELILHAGDVGGQQILEELGLIAPVRAVFGNTDPPDLPGLEKEIFLTVGGLTLHVSHGHEVGRPTPEKLTERYDADVLVYGHTHRPQVTRFGGRLVINPGAAGPPRFNLLPSVGRLTISGREAEVEIVELT